MKHKIWLKISFLQFVLTAVMGLMLRYMFLGIDIGFNFKHLLHAHSHTGFLGWISMAIFVAMVAAFAPRSIQDKTYRRIFLATEITILGMLFSFPFQGYAAISITFSSLFLLTSYWFVTKFYKEIKHLSTTLTSVKFVRASLFYLVLSSLGPWGLAPVMATGHGKNDLYYLIIFFYLHFLYNGAFIMGLFGLLFKYLEDRGLKESLAQKGKRFFLFTNIAVIPTYVLSTLWLKPPTVLFWVGGVFAAIQLVGIWYFLPFGKLFLRYIRAQNKLAFHLISLAGISFILKLVFQFFSAIPFLAKDIKSLRSTVVMGYMHLVTLGIISFFLIGWFLLVGGFSAKGKLAKNGLYLFVIGVFLSELLLFFQGYFFWIKMDGIPNYHLLLGIVSSLMPIGLGLFSIKLVLGDK